MNEFEALKVSISPEVVLHYSVAIAVAVNVFGFVIATLHYSRVGVNPGKLPLPVIWGAGASFTAMTWFCVHVGLTAVRLWKAGAPGEGAAYIGLAVMFVVVLSAYLLRYFGPLVYIFMFVLLGVLWGATGAPRPIPQFAGSDITFPVPAMGLIATLAALWVYGNIVYGDLARALGGAAPSPIRLELASEFGFSIPAAARVYEVISDADSIILELEYDPTSEVKRREDMTSLYFPVRNRYPPCRFVRLPRSAVRLIEYTDTFARAPKFARLEGTDSADEDAGKSPSDPPWIK